MCDHPQCSRLISAAQCVDQPIPYQLTPAGREALMEADNPSIFDLCDHRPARVGNRFECTRCGDPVPIFRSSGPVGQLVKRRRD